MSSEEAQDLLFTDGAAVSGAEDHHRAPPFPGRDPRASEVILPKCIYIRDRHGRYLINGSGPQYATITFRTGEANLDCAFEAVQTAASCYRLVARTGKNIVRYCNKWYSSDGLGSPSFYVITAAGNKVYLKDNYSPALFFSDELRSSGAPVGRDYISEGSLMEIIQASIKNDIIDVKYEINQAKVHDVAPIIALSTSVRNDSDSNVNQTLTYTYEKWAVGTWNNSVGVEIGANSKATFKAGVPFVTRAEFEISVSASYSHEWGGEEGTKQIITSSTTVAVPPKKKARATVVVRNARIDVPFTYTQRILWSNGQTQDFKKTGIYNNVDSWHVDVVLGNWESV